MKPKEVMDVSEPEDGEKETIQDQADRNRVRNLVHNQDHNQDRSPEAEEGQPPDQLPEEQLEFRSPPNRRRTKTHRRRKKKSPESHSFAEAKMKEINAAYAELKKYYGVK